MSDGAGTFTVVTSGPLVARTDISKGGMLLDATGDGSADDVMVFHHGEPNGGEAKEHFFCRSCDDGWFSAPSVKACRPCPAYSVGVSMMNEKCQYYPSGRVGPTSQASIPIQGWRSDQQYACGTCVPGKFRGHTHQIEACMDCAVGQYASAGASEV